MLEHCPTPEKWSGILRFRKPRRSPDARNLLLLQGRSGIFCSRKDPARNSGRMKTALLPKIGPAYSAQRHRIESLAVPILPNMRSDPRKAPTEIPEAQNVQAHSVPEALPRTPDASRITAGRTERSRRRTSPAARPHGSQPGNRHPLRLYRDGEVPVCCLKYLPKNDWVEKLRW